MLKDPNARGILPAHALEAAFRCGWLQGAAPEAGQVQPASLDLRLGGVAYRLPFSFLPGRRQSVAQAVERHAMHRLSLDAAAVLERGCVYLVPLEEAVALPPHVSASANPKSSTGRLDVFARVITDRATEFDRIPPGYKGPLWVELSPRTFSIKVRRGSRLVQLRLRLGDAAFALEELAALNLETPLARPAAALRDGLVAFHVDTLGDGVGPIAYRARKHAGLVDVDAPKAHAAAAFWEEIRPRPGGGLVLDPDDFYILASKERVVVPPAAAAEMVAYDTLVGEFRVHYAGFFDPGFGWTDGTRAVLEVRSHEVPFLLDDGQLVGHLKYERMAARPARLYGEGLGSHYARQDLTLSKHFA
ncbi:MAG: 2'-deoxycytidine 5'-triphosphate deaminase [Geminicoccaceae bacterium]|nr:MAG: 2'-deoxycytidine 5'-triphosphate deaminase [Geminicoccaceae bacterium]